MARKWMLKANELAEQERQLKSKLPEHCAMVLKSLPVFKGMPRSCKHPDKQLFENKCHGFDLLGDLSKSNVFNSRATFATLTPGQVRSTARFNREAIFNSVSKAMGQEICEGVYDAILQEIDQGWLEGPVKVDSLGDHDIVTRRFGVEQFSTRG